MGMPVTVEIADRSATQNDVEEVYSYFDYIDRTFSTYKNDSEISRINRREIGEEEWSGDMRRVLALSKLTQAETNGFFDIRKPDGSLDPSGLVKGWAIKNAADLLEKKGYKNFYVDAGGDIQTKGLNKEGKKWSVGIRDPFAAPEIKIVGSVYLSGEGIATSGTYVRGDHIYNPYEAAAPQGIASITVIGPDVYEADRFATAAFAMGKKGIEFIGSQYGLEGYMIDDKGIAMWTRGFKGFTREQ
jgi:thiamine biosynthesis lipoprotein